MYRRIPPKRLFQQCSFAFVAGLGLSTMVTAWTTTIQSHGVLRKPIPTTVVTPTSTTKVSNIKKPWCFLYASNLSGDGGDYGDDGRSNQIPSTRPSGSWQLRNSFEQFLNQCAIQSLLFHMVSLKDRYTALWLEDFTKPIIHSRTKENDGRDQLLSNMASAWNNAMHETRPTERTIQLLTYHGLDAINTTVFPTWDDYFKILLQQPTVEYTIESSRPAGMVPSYTLDIVPASLCSRILSVREQIAQEFVNDLDVIAEQSLTAMDKYRGSSNQKLDRIHQYFLEMSIHEDYKPSPLRKGNFDLLLSMTTQEAIHRILNKWCENNNNGNNDKNQERWVDYSAKTSASVQFLRNFYAQRIGTHFTGSNYYGRADDFLDELLQISPRMVQLQDSVSGWVDPDHLVDMIFKVRVPALLCIELNGVTRLLSMTGGRSSTLNVRKFPFPFLRLSLCRIGTGEGGIRMDRNFT
jgi:hypothetical protein